VHNDADEMERINYADRIKYKETPNSKKHWYKQHQSNNDEFRIIIEAVKKVPQYGQNELCLVTPGCAHILRTRQENTQQEHMS
jgi:hypothetical protein